MKIGTEVKWKSGAGGSRALEKRGKIVAIVPADADPYECIGWGWEQKKKMFDGGPRNHTSYFVAVENKIYWPRVNHLKTVGKK